MKKRLIALGLVLLMLLAVLPAAAFDDDPDIPEAPSAGAETPEPAEGSEDISAPGGWIMAEDEAVTPERRALFERAFQGLKGVHYEPLSYQAYQIVNGTNHLFIADAVGVYPDAEPVRVFVYIHEDPEGNAEVYDIVEPELPVGGWTAAEDATVTPELQDLFARAVQDLDGASYEPVAYVASQLVSGTNHLFIAEKTIVYPGAEPTRVLVYIYEDLEGNVQVTDIVELESEPEPVIGGWVMAEDPTITPELQELFSHASAGLVGAHYEPVSYVAWQIVNGTNHLVVAEIVGVYPDAEPVRVFVYIHEDLEGNAEIYNIVELESEPERPFEDVAEEDWFYDAAYYCFDQGYFKGVTTTSFDPDGNMTRAMFATVLYRFAGEPEVDGVVAFEDISVYAYYADAVIWAAGEGIINGYGNGLFGPNDPVTREQIVTMLWRYNGSPVIDGVDLSGYKDADEISDWSRDAMDWAVSTGLIQGSKSLLNPNGTATRAEVAQVISNLAASHSGRGEDDPVYVTANGVEIRELSVNNVGSILYCFGFRLSNPTDQDQSFDNTLFKLTTAAGTEIATAAPYCSADNVKAGLQYYMVSIVIMSPELLSLGDEVSFYYDGTFIGTAIAEYWDISDQSRASEPVYTTAEGVEVRDFKIRPVGLLYNFAFTLSNPTDQDAQFEDAWFTLYTADGTEIVTSAPYFSPNEVPAGTTYYRISVPIQSTELLHSGDEVTYYCQGNLLGTVVVE